MACPSPDVVSMVPEGTAKYVLPTDVIWLALWSVALRPGTVVNSWIGLTTFNTVFPSWIAAVLSTAKLDASGWISTALCIPGLDARRLYPPINGEDVALNAVWGWSFPIPETGIVDNVASFPMFASWDIGTPEASVIWPDCVVTKWAAIVAGPDVALVRRGRFEGGAATIGVKVMRTLFRCWDLYFSSLARLRCSSHCCSKAKTNARQSAFSDI